MAYSDDNTAYETISLKEAREIAAGYNKRVGNATLIKWIDEHVPKLGHQPGGNNGGKWYVFKHPFIAFISGQEALCNQLLVEMAKIPPTEELTQHG